MVGQRARLAEAAQVLSARLAEGTTSRPFSNFFVIRDRKAVDLGGKRPSGLDSSPGGAAVVIEDRKQKTNSAQRLGSVDEARKKGRDRIDRERRTDLVAIVGRAIGRRGGETIYQDVVGFEFKP